MYVYLGKVSTSKFAFDQRKCVMTSKASCADWVSHFWETTNLCQAWFKRVAINSSENLLYPLVTMHIDVGCISNSKMTSVELSPLFQLQKPGFSIEAHDFSMGGTSHGDKGHITHHDHVNIVH